MLLSEVVYCTVMVDIILSMISDSCEGNCTVQASSFFFVQTVGGERKEGVL